MPIWVVPILVPWCHALFRVTLGSFHDPGMKVLDPGMPLSRLISNLQYDHMGMVELVTASRFAKKDGSKCLIS